MILRSLPLAKLQLNKSTENALDWYSQIAYNLKIEIEQNIMMVLNLFREHMPLMFNLKKPIVKLNLETFKNEDLLKIEKNDILTKKEKNQQIKQFYINKKKEKNNNNKIKKTQELLLLVKENIKEFELLYKDKTTDNKLLFAT